MKLRIQGNSVRLRLSQSEVARFAAEGSIEDGIEFGPDVRWTYALERSKDIASPRAFYREGSLRVQVPGGDAEDWVKTDRVGIWGGEGVLVAVEKDFKCMHGDSEEYADTFPNPLEAASKME